MIGARGVRIRRYLKRFLYFQLSLRSAAMIMLGREQPLVRFTVEGDPPSIYLVFEILPEFIDALAQQLGLPLGLELCPVRCLSGDTPGHYLTLNIYRVSGITNGTRAEWSIYVADEEYPGTPRYLVIDARSDTTSMDPVDVITRPSTVSHARSGNTLESVVGDEPSALRCTIDLSTLDDQAAITSLEWVTANDRIYWTNGVRDRTFYDAGLAAPRVALLGPAALELSDDSPWSGLVAPAPRYVLVHRDPVEFVVSPWDNVDDLKD